MRDVYCSCSTVCKLSRRCLCTHLHGVLLLHTQGLSRAGCHRTAFELTKLLLALEPEDPLGATCLIDYLALRAGGWVAVSPRDCRPLDNSALTWEGEQLGPSKHGGKACAVVCCVFHTVFHANSLALLLVPVPCLVG